MQGDDIVIDGVLPGRYDVSIVQFDPTGGRTTHFVADVAGSSHSKSTRVPTR
jgi:hypothetical protein